MAYDLKDLFDTLPALHRLRDHAEGKAARGRVGQGHSLTDAADFGPLKSLLSVLIREGQIVEDDIRQLYDDHFIETCDPWLIPYIGELVGARPLEDFGDDQSGWPNDGKCDDPRFDGPGADAVLLGKDVGHDATDCRKLCAAGKIGMRNY